MGRHIKQNKCLVLEMRQDGRLPPLGKREAHPPHVWWYTSWGGGHQLSEVSHPEKNWDTTEGHVWEYLCLGREHYGA